jgi:hypothetical protein
VTYAGRVAEHTFHVGVTPLSKAVAKVRALVEPQARSVRVGAATNVDAYVENASSANARGCWLTPDYPLAALFSFQLLNAKGKAIAKANENFDVPKRSTVRVRLKFKGRAGAKAYGIEIPVHVKCLNSQAKVGSGTPVRSGYNTLWLTFDTPNPPNIQFASSVKATDVAMMPAANSVRMVNLKAKNLGGASSSAILLQPRKTAAMKLDVTICELNAANACKAPFAKSLKRKFGAGKKVRLRLRLRSTGAIKKQIVTRRLIVEAIGDGLPRGATSFAVATP